MGLSLPMNTNNQSQNPPALHKRWTFEEQEHLVRHADKMQHGSLSWARATTGPSRPEVKGPVKHDFRPITSLEACKRKILAAIPHNPKEVVRIDKDKDKSVKDVIKSLEKDIQKREENLSLRNRLDNFYASCIIARAPAPELPKPQEIKLTKTRTSVVEKLKDKIVAPREDEGYVYDKSNHELRHQKIVVPLRKL